MYLVLAWVHIYAEKNEKVGGSSLPFLVRDGVEIFGAMVHVCLYLEEEENQTNNSNQPPN